MDFIDLPCGPLGANCYILADEKTNRCLAIDPSDSEAVLEVLHQKNLILNKIILTHGHFDHCMGVASLKSVTGAEVSMHQADLELIDGTIVAMRTQFPRVPVFKPDRFFDHRDTIDMDSIHLLVLHTPGHSKGSVCFYMEDEDYVFCGDTLFKNSYGRTDLYGGSMKEIAVSINNVLFKLPETVTAFPGHGEETLLALEKRFNPMARLKNHPWVIGK